MAIERRNQFHKKVGRVLLKTPIDQEILQIEKWMNENSTQILTECSGTSGKES